MADVQRPAEAPSNGISRGSVRQRAAEWEKSSANPHSPPSSSPPSPARKPNPYPLHQPTQPSSTTTSSTPAALPTAPLRKEEIVLPRISRVALRFSAAVETLLAPLDDALIPPAQRLWRSPPFRALFLLITTLTAIETALILPSTLYALGHDAAAGLSTSILLTLALLSQVPKKFIWRRRPWMASRALPFRRDKTSSFPSRAVVCGVVFAYLATTAPRLASPTLAPFPPAFVAGAIGLSAAFAALARVAAGAHYPSDCLCGVVLGVAIVNLGAGLEVRWLSAGCGVVASAAQSAARALPAPLSMTSRFHHIHFPDLPLPESVTVASWANLRTRVLYTRLLVCLGASYVLTLLSIAGFWVKCSYVYGLLLAPATFRYVFLASAATGLSARSLSGPGPLLEQGRTALWFAGVLAFGMATRGRKGPFRVFAFTAVYFSTLYLIMSFRLK